MMKYAVVTGATSGIGREVAIQLHKLGWFVAMFDLDHNQLLQMQVELGERSFISALDVTEPQAITQALAKLAEMSEGQLHLLFNSAGILEIGNFEQINLQRHNSIINVNVNGVINCCHEAFQYLSQTPSAKVINMCSASAQYGVPQLASYSASKFAVRGLTEALNIEWQKFDISVSDIMPPFVKTPMLDQQQKLAPVVDRMGINLTAIDVARSVLAVIEKPVVHKPVSLQFAVLYYLGQVMPGFITRAIMARLSREQ